MRTLVVGDHALVCQGLAALLERQKDLVPLGMIPDGPEAAAKARALGAEVIVFVANQQGATQRASLQSVCEEAGDAKVLLVAIADDDEALLAALRMGVRGVIDKNASSASLVQAIRDVMNGEVVVPKLLARQLVAEYTALSSAGSGRHGRSSELTDRELEVLRLLAEGDTNRAIASRLCVSEHTIRAHLRRVMQKLRVQNRVQAATYALTNGLATVGAPPPAP